MLRSLQKKTLTKYLTNRDDFTLLSPSFCYPENWDLPFPPEIIIRNKSKYIDISLIKDKKFIFLLKKLKKILIVKFSLTK
jgi:hypothetical protein